MSEKEQAHKPDRQALSLSGQEQKVFPVLRHASLLKKYPDRWVTKAHTADTVLLYALDLGEGYTLIEQSLLTAAACTEDKLHQHAMENLQNLPFSVKTQKVAGNSIHFISPQDGYAASRILLDSVIRTFDEQKQGDALGVAIPHQDVLVIADMVGDAGANLLARLTYDFASKGQVPISVLPFYWEDGELTPFIVVSHGSETAVQRKPPTA
ncbi:DUF1444 family protein [Brevibacillus reuszeri]|uniref:DUF1444 family protein n=1 Tax=Brevibacillus reuszeri TaxID=54915 RepID=UPI00289FE120|nr:DUF1444 family protein [Brevibacillus reuszeri]